MKTLNPSMPASFTDRAVEMLGASAATTYSVLREKGASASAALRLARAQIAMLGFNYPGGFDCLPYRRISNL